MGDYVKQQDAWVDFKEDMLAYCRQDVEVTEAVYKHLMKEMNEDG